MRITFLNSLSWRMPSYWKVWEEEKAAGGSTLPPPSSSASVEIIRPGWSLAANFFPPLQNKIIKRMRVRQRQETPTVPGSLLPVMEYSCGVSHDKTQKVVWSPCLSPHTLVTAAACLRACVWACAPACVCLCTLVCASVLPPTLSLFFPLRWHVVSLSSLSARSLAPALVFLISLI